MRCPKCGFITFDHQEACPKCGKNIASAVKDLSGTVFKTDLPTFLKVEVYERDDEVDAGVDQEITGDIDVEFSLDADEDSIVGEESAEVEFDLLDESQEAESEEESIDLQLSTGETEELDLEVKEDTTSVEEEAGPQLDFSELDISDLGPPETETEEASAELTLEDSAGGPPSPPGGAAAGHGGSLEDLQMDGFDLGMETLSPTKATSDMKLKPGVKTGTALDDFDIDLGDLLSGQEK